MSNPLEALWQDFLTLIHKHRATLGQLPAPTPVASTPSVSNTVPVATTTVPVAQSSGTTTVTAYDTPDENGLVALTGLTSGWKSYRFAIQEVALAVGGDLGARAQANVDYGNAEYGITHIIIPTCKVPTKQQNGTYQVTPDAPQIPNSRALPHSVKAEYKGVQYDLGTVQGATEYYNTIPVDGPK